MLEEVGIKVEIEVLEWSAYQSRIWAADNIEHFVLMGLGNSMFDHWFSMRALMCEGAYRNRVHWCHERFDELMLASEVEVDEEAREELLHEASYIVLEERPWITLFQLQNLNAVANDVDWTPRPDELLWMFDAQPAN